MARRLIGTGTTDANGKVSVSYEGEGTGILQIVAESGSLLSETYELLDALKVDNGTTNSHNDTIWNNTDYMTRGDEYTAITRDGGEVLKYTAIEGDIAIEMDLMTSMSNSGQLLSIRNGSTNIQAITGANCGMTTDTWKHIKITIKDSKLSIDGGTLSEVSVTGFNRLYVRSASTYQTCFKNLKIYSI